MKNADTSSSVWEINNIFVNDAKRQGRDSMPYKKLSESNKKMFLREIEEMKSQILQKEHEIAKLSFNMKRIEESIPLSIATQKNNIISAQEMINDLQHDLDNKVSFTEMGVLIKKAEMEVIRHTKNIQARKMQIRQGVLENPNRDEKAREKIRKRIEEEGLNDETFDEVTDELAKTKQEDENNGQPETEEAGQQESSDKPEA